MSFRRLADGLGIAVPDTSDLVEFAVALGLVATAWVIAWFAGKKGGPALAALWERHAGERSHGIADRMCNLVRNLVAALLFAVLLAAYSWPLGPAMMIGLALATAVALLAADLVRGVRLPRWTALLLAAFAFVAVLARAIGGLDPITDALDGTGFDIGSRRISLFSIIQVMVTLVVLLAVIRLTSRVVNHSIKRAGRLDATQQLLAQKLAGIALLIIAFFVGIDLVGIDLTALAVFSGALGLAVGFGLQKTFGNLIAGIILLMDRSIKPGDVIAVGDSFGSVNKIGVRAVSIITREGKEHLIPNELLMTEEVVNWSYSSRNVRISIPVGVAYDCDIQLAQKLMAEAAVASPRVLDNPTPKVWLREFGESSIDHEIRLWIEDPEDGIAPIRSDILNRLWLLFKENGIGIPFPTRDLNIRSWPEGEPPVVQPASSASSERRA